MMACTSPAFTSRSMPLRISLPATRALKSEILSKCPSSRDSADRAFQADGEQILGLDREFHGQLLEYDLAEATDDHVDRVFCGYAALQAVEQLVLADSRGARFVLDGRSLILDFHVGKGVGRTFWAHQQGIALGEIARTARARQDFHETAVG